MEFLGFSPPVGRGPRTTRSQSHSPGGRNVVTIQPIHENRPVFFNTTQCHGQMAPFGRKYLVCFYCNQKSGIKYDGFITQWECGQCESTNFLDAKGDITDPPVFTDHEAATDLKYAINRPEPPSSQTSQGSDSPFFCSTCLKNQHLYTASLAQYHIETDPAHPQYKESERNYFQFRKDLEKRYPQVCEDCQPKVLERMKQAGRTAKTDYLRRLMDKSRARRSAHRSDRIALSSVLESVGKILWYVGLFGQLLWHITALAAATQHNYPRILDFYLPNFVFSTLSSLAVYIPTSRVLGRWCLICTAASVWWNPKFKHLNNGFMKHIKGWADWYKYQALLLLIRGLFYFCMGSGIMADPFAAPTGTAHAFIFGFITYLSIAAHRSLKIDMTPLWASTPERLPHVGPSSSPSNGIHSMADILDQIGAASFQRDRPVSIPSPPPSPPPHQRYQRGTLGNGSPIQSLKTTGPLSIQRRTTTSVFDINNASASQSQHPSDELNSLNLEEMDWSPGQLSSPHRAFNSVKPVDKYAEFFGRTPVVDHPSPFWYKVPPAPITPAQRLRNPPNQPRLRVSSQEVKENFFNKVTQNTLPPEQATGGRNQGIEFAQQKFFPPAPPSEAGNHLADLLTGFSLAESETPNKTENRSRVRHFCQGLALFLALVFWNHSLNNVSEQTRTLTLAVMAACILIGARTIMDNTFYGIAEQNAMMKSFKACLGGIECVAACYGSREILLGRGGSDNCASLGTILVGGMMVQEIWVASFG